MVFFFDNSQQFINLKKKQPFIEIHFKVFINFVDHFKVPIGIVIITFASLAFLGSVFVSKANVATLYPDSCLGGWDNPINASGKPDLDSSAKPEEFTKGNSAVIKGTSEIYCGGFTGEIPSDTSPKNFILSLNWSIDDGSIIHNDIEQSDSGVVIPDSIVPEVIETPENNTDDAPETQKIDSDQQSFLDRFIPKVYAQDSETPEPISIETPPIIPEPTIPQEINDINTEVKSDTLPAPEENKDEDLQITDDTIVPSDDTESSQSTENSSASFSDTGNDVPVQVPAPVEEPTDSFMEVLYTIDGTVWNSLGKIGRNNWQNISFSIPLTSWEDLNQFQISLRPIQTIDTYPAIYLDGMLLSVEYESELKVEVEEAVPIYEITSIQNTGTKIFLTNEGTILSPDQILITGENDVLGNIAVYDKISEEVLLTTTVAEKIYPLDLSYFGEGEYIVINTSDPDSCSSRTLIECLSGFDFIGSASFSIKNKTAPPETLDSTQTIDNSNQNTGGIDPLPGSTLPQIPSDPIIENAPDKVLDIFNIDDISEQNNSTDNSAESQALPPIDTSSSQEVSF